MVLNSPSHSLVSHMDSTSSLHTLHSHSSLSPLHHVNNNLTPLLSIHIHMLSHSHLNDSFVVLNDTLNVKIVDSPSMDSPNSASPAKTKDTKSTQNDLNDSPIHSLYDSISIASLCNDAITTTPLLTLISYTILPLLHLLRSSNTPFTPLTINSINRFSTIPQFANLSRLLYSISLILAPITPNPILSLFSVLVFCYSSYRF